MDPITLGNNYGCDRKECCTSQPLCFFSFEHETEWYQILVILFVGIWLLHREKLYDTSHRETAKRERDTSEHANCSTALSRDIMSIVWLYARLSSSSHHCASPHLTEIHLSLFCSRSYSTLILPSPCIHPVRRERPPKKMALSFPVRT